MKYKLKEDSGGYEKGTEVYSLNGYDYGLASDDTRMTGVQHISVTLKSDGDYPSFTVATHKLEKSEEKQNAN